LSLHFLLVFAEASRKNIQMTEKWMAEKCLPRFAADATPRGAAGPGMIPNSIFLSFIFLSLLLFKPT
jgi:hypothetical protein